ncbi:MFS transporter [Limnochorda pilosa]|uniref:Major facilitator superfamily (MFS) profile domain-containing protein n=1 Tax=Limnochorda pilosa TaxID=1555112 RepID=A0A0K2SNF6_LIMPI|nr:MFS transporter [Limnochorda pilosa]BAS28364.1 hypothetical protein LIP_2534 [Limnochorda pilosa]
MARSRYLAVLGTFSPTARAYLAYTLFNSISFNMLNLVFNLYLHSLGHPRDFIGLVNGVPSIAVLILGLPIGMAADRYGYRRFLVAGAVLNVVALGGMVAGGNGEALMGFSVLRGLAWALTWVLGPPLLMSESTEENRVHLFSLQFAIMMGSGFLGSLLAGFLPEALASAWSVAPDGPGPLRATFAVAVAFMALAVVPAFLVREGPHPEQGSPLPRTAQEALLFVHLLLPSALVSFGAGAMVVFFQLFFSLRFGMAPAEMGILFALAAVVTAAATLATPQLSSRLGKVRTVVVTELASIPFLLVLSYSYSLPWVIAAYYVRQALMNMGAPAQTAFLMEQVRPDQRATLTSLNAMLGSLGRGGLGPVVSGWMQVRWDFTGAFTLTTVLYVLGSMLFYLFFRNVRETAAGGLTPPAVPGGAALPRARR